MATTTHIGPIEVSNIFFAAGPNYPSLYSNGSRMAINAKGLDGIYLNPENGNFVSFGDGAGGEIGRVNQVGDASFAGNISNSGDMEVGGSLRVDGNFLLGPPAGPRINSSNGSRMEIDAHSLDGIYINFNSGNFIAFGDGAGNQRASINGVGEGDFSGGVSTAQGMTAAEEMTARMLVAMGIPDDFPFAAHMMDFDPTGAGGAGSGNVRVMAVEGEGMPTWNLQMVPDDGNPIHTYIRADVDGSKIPRLTLPENTSISGDLAVTGKITAATIAGPVNLTGDLTVSGQLTAGTAQIGGMLAAGSLTAIDDLTAADAAFGTCTVAGSPVRTFANTANPPAQVYPGAGLALSTGAAWGASIDPATLQRTLTLTTLGISGPATLIGTTLNIPQYAGAPMVYPGAGIGVSTGAAWGASIDPASIAYLAVSNQFTGASVFASLSVNAPSTTVPPGMGTLNWIASPNNILSFVARGTGASEIGGVQLNGASGDGVTYHSYITCDYVSGVPQTTIDENLIVNGSVIINAVSATLPPNAAMLDWVPSPGNHLRFIARGLNATDVGGMEFNGASGDGATFHPYLYCTYGAGVGTIAVGGNLTASGTKAFVIAHPLDDTKDLTHVCLEGPEVGLYYRGEVTTVNGSAEVTLPDYFEALTRPIRRTVYLTQTFEDDATEFCMLMASRIVDGKFRVRSSIPSAIVCWQVEALRGDVAELEVVTEKKQQRPPLPVSPEENHDSEPNDSTDRTRADEDGAIRHQASASTRAASGKSRGARRTH